jgi:hypothetical protein
LSKSFVVASDPKILNNFSKQKYKKILHFFAVVGISSPHPLLIANRDKPQTEGDEREVAFKAVLVDVGGGG